MTAHRRIQITIQTDQVVTIRRRGCIRRWCPECGSDVDVVDILQAEALAGAAQPKLRDCAEDARWHSVEGSDGAPLVCLESVLKSM